MKLTLNERRHFKALEQAFWNNLSRQDDCEYGSIGLDCKRPFGNSDVEGDILEIIGATPEGDGDEGFTDEQRQYAADLYNRLPDYLRSKYFKK